MELGSVAQVGETLLSCGRGHEISSCLIRLRTAQDAHHDIAWGMLEEVSAAN